MDSLRAARIAEVGFLKGRSAALQPESYLRAVQQMHAAEFPEDSDIFSAKSLHCRRRPESMMLPHVTWISSFYNATGSR
ncbi:MAG: hypothetical protein U0989_07505 [Azonexus sp.]|nr:hypothetical protein [Azonexus sp.]